MKDLNSLPISSIFPCTGVSARLLLGLSNDNVQAVPEQEGKVNIEDLVDLCFEEEFRKKVSRYQYQTWKKTYWPLGASFLSSFAAVRFIL